METNNLLELKKKLISPNGNTKYLLDKNKEAQDKGLLHILYQNSHPTARMGVNIRGMLGIIYH